jgi:hypothetical protein
MVNEQFPVGWQEADGRKSSRVEIRLGGTLCVWERGSLMSRKVEVSLVVG